MELEPKNNEGNIREALPSYENLPPKDGEMEATYLARFQEELYKNQRFHQKAEVDEVKDQLLRFLAQNPLNANEQTRENFSQLIEPLRGNLINTFSAASGRNEPGEQNYFNDGGMIRTRDFMSAGGDSYARFLFGLFHILSHEQPGLRLSVIEYLKSRLDGKKILNIGGGNSLLDILASSISFGSGTIVPEIVVNVDPHLVKESIKVGQKKNYRSVNVSGADVDLLDKLQQDGCPTSYDEIWALFSLPSYLIEISEFGIFFDNLKRLLSPGGIARIYPLSISKHKEYPYDSPDNDLKRKEAIEKEIFELAEEKGFAASLLPIERLTDNDWTLLIQRLK